MAVHSYYDKSWPTQDSFKNHLCRLVLLLRDSRAPPTIDSKP